MSASQYDPALLELLGFLSSDRPEIRRIALANLLPYTASSSPERGVFQRDNYVEQIATMCADIELIAHDALSALINLTNSGVVAARIAKIEGFLTGLVRMIVDDKALLSDLAAMLLSNLTKVESVSIQLLNLKVAFVLDTSSADAEAVKVDKTEKDDVVALDLLLEIFLKGEGKKYNPNANYDFLASVFANVSTLPAGRSYLLATPHPDVEPPLVKLISFTEHPSTIRRGGVASSIKNAAFEKSAHTRLVAPTNGAAPTPGSIDLLPQMLLPLCGNEEFDIDVLDELPEELQLLPPDKKREPDSAIRMILVETLVLLCTTRACRDAMRVRGVYQVIREAHLAETVNKVTEPMVRLVDLLKREEGPDTAIEEVDVSPSSNVSEQNTVFVDASGKETKAAAPEPVSYTRPPPPPQVDSEDEEEMLIEV
ncbi:protein Hgh1 [Pseudohyphozyma bogoriensis]|nr:protein Hgh1 [Pseudohyphozyma bogoriensis]